ncbi:Heterogeneous nuclear ribonucleoprotein R [Armadillidium nasatum]|uniref:Heterogeneous nuclear ribonucleoprotein R n=1 Tax=Armadillidium nasatum TaxID=96803 RepID=A0A5N5TGY6_9CRUS|nr:Heterogeneous nuclear ribonucleoprotein R [Armadillidium nasatum]
MAEGNEGGGEATVQQVEDSERTEDYQKLIDYGLNEKVAVKLDEIYQQGKLKHEDLDERALDALKEFPVEGAVTVLKQFLESNLEHVSNKSAYLCGVMKTYRQRKQYNYDFKNKYGKLMKVHLHTATSTSGDSLTLNPGKGPNKEKLKAIIDKSGYTLDVTTGQRKYGGPPPNWEGPAPGPGCEVFCGKIPKDLYEDELIPLFENCGTVWDLRLMMDPLTGQNRGYAFVTFTTREAANEAVKQLDNYTIRDNATLKVNISIPNLRLFVGNIPKSKSQEEILEEFSKRTAE